MAFHSCIAPFLLLLLFPLNVPCQNSSTYLNLGTVLSPSTNLSTILSSSGDYAFGFRALDTDPTHFLLAVYYYKIKAKTVIWTANEGNPVPNQAKAVLTSDGQLTLKDSSNQHTWSASIRRASHGSMLDNGNFVLYFGSTVIWQTFDHPTDTILPGQILNQDTTIFAKITDDDYSKGRFKFVMQTDGNLVLYEVGFPTTTETDSYYSTATQGNPGNIKFVFSETGSLYLSFNNGSRVPVLPEPSVTGEYYLRATLDPDGGFRQYTFPKGQPSTGSWSVAANLVQDLCSKNFNVGSGICGFNSYCTQYDNGLTNCQCPPHYTFIDGTRKYKGCKPSYVLQQCEESSGSSYGFEAIKNLDWPFSDAERLSPLSERQCQDECLDDCFCLVAIYKDDGTCWKKKFPLSNGKLEQDVDRVAFIKYNKLNVSAVENVNNDGQSQP